MTGHEPAVGDITVVVHEVCVSEDPGLTGYLKIRPHGDGRWEFSAAVRPGLGQTDRERTLAWITRNVKQFAEIGPDRAGLFAIGDDPANGWHAYARTVLGPSTDFLNFVDLDADR